MIINPYRFGSSITVGILPMLAQSNGGTDQNGSGSTVFPGNTWFIDYDNNNALVDASGGFVTHHSPFGRFSLMVQVAIRYRADYPSRKIIIADNMLPATSIILLRKGNDIYDEWVAGINAVRTAEEGSGGVVQIEPVVWQQGESDADADAKLLYEDRVIAVVDEIRADLSEPTLPFTFGLPSQPWIDANNHNDPDDVPAILQGMVDKRLYTAVADTRLNSVQVGDVVHYDEAGLIAGGNDHVDAWPMARANTTYPAPVFTGSISATEITQAAAQPAPVFTGTISSNTFTRT